MLAWGLTVPLLAWALIRVAGLEAGWPLVQILAFTPYALALALLALLAAVLLRRWLPAFFLGVAAVLFVLVVGGRGFGAPEPVGEGHPVRILTANLDRGRADATELLGLADARDVDLLVLTELTPAAAAGLARAGVDQLFPQRLAAPAPETAGAGIWSRWPLVRKNERSGRGLRLLAAVRVPDSIPVDLGAVRIIAPAGRRSTAEWSQDLRDLPTAGSIDLPLVLAGSFNATLDHARLRQLLDTGYRDAGAETGRGLSFTRPATLGWPPPVTADHILAESGIGFSDYDVEPITGAGHRAVFAELVLPGPAPG